MVRKIYPPERFPRQFLLFCGVNSRLQGELLFHHEKISRPLIQKSISMIF